MSVTKRNGRYMVRVDYDADADGKRRRHSIGTFRTKKEAEAKEREAITAKDRGVDFAPAKIVVRELVERFIRSREAIGLETRTVEEYRRVLALYIEPHLGSRLVGKLKPMHVSEWLAVLAAQRSRNGPPLSPKTRQHAFGLLSSSLRWGLKQEIVTRNVCDVVDVPKQARSNADAHSGDELQRLTDTAAGTRWEHFVELALLTGARRGELVALRWSDVDLDGRSVRVRSSISQSASGVERKGTKSGRERTVPLSEAAMAAFRAQAALQAADRAKHGSAYVLDDDASVFTDELGERVTPKAATNAFGRLALTAKLSSTSLHRLRHTATSIMNLQSGQSRRGKLSGIQLWQ